MRELDRERTKMEQQEKKIIADIKKMAKQGQMDAVRVMAKVITGNSLYLLREKLYFFFKKSLISFFAIPYFRI